MSATAVDLPRPDANTEGAEAPEESATATLWVRDEHGRQCPLRVEIKGPDSAARLAKLRREMERLERRSRHLEAKWQSRHRSLSDGGDDAGRNPEAMVTSQPLTPPVRSGNPWEGPRFSFAHLLGEGETWSGPDSLWIWETDGDRIRGPYCRFCSHLLELPIGACCLNCDRTGRDLVIPGVRPDERPRPRATVETEGKPSTLAGGIGKAKPGKLKTSTASSTPRKGGTATWRAEFEAMRKQVRK